MERDLSLQWADDSESQEPAPSYDHLTEESLLPVPKEPSRICTASDLLWIYPQVTLHSTSAECHFTHSVSQIIQYLLSGYCGLSPLDAEINEKGHISQELPGHQGRARHFEGIRTAAQSSDVWDAT